MSGAIQNGTTSTTPVLTGGQQNVLGAQTNAYTGTFLPGYQQAFNQAGNVYNQNLGGVTNAAQNLAGTAGQAQNVLGSTGQQALTTGIGGLSNLFAPDYMQNQINATLGPTQLQYQQNLANQGAQFGGAGQLGSARQALAGQQLAQSNQINQAAQAAQLQNQITGQRLSAGSTLGQLGQSGLSGSINAANTGVAASQVPSSMYGQYLQQIAGIPNQMPNYSGTIGSLAQNTTNQVGNVNAGTVAGTIGGISTGLGALGSLLGIGTNTAGALGTGGNTVAAGTDLANIAGNAGTAYDPSTYGVGGATNISDLNNFFG